MQWKGKIKGGNVCNSLTSTIDIFPTIASIVQQPLPDKKIDGVSLLPILNGDLTARPRDEFYYYYRKNSLEAVRSGDWKLVLAHPGRTYLGFPVGKDGHPGQVDENFAIEQALFDLRRDPGERYDVQKEFPDVVNELLKLADKAREDLGDDILDKPGSNRRPIGQIAE
jgi:arylsulfatase